MAALLGARVKPTPRRSTRITKHLKDVWEGEADGALSQLAPIAAKAAGLMESAALMRMKVTRSWTHATGALTAVAIFVFLPRMPTPQQLLQQKKQRTVETATAVLLMGCVASMPRKGIPTMTLGRDVRVEAVNGAWLPNLQTAPLKHLVRAALLVASATSMR